MSYRLNTITIRVLSETDISEMEIGTVLRECDVGELVLRSTGFEVRELSGAEMADELVEAGSDPSFFHLLPDGTPDPDFL